MAVDDLSVLKGQLPEVFETRPVPGDFEDEWVIVNIENVEAGPEELENLVSREDSVAPPRAPPLEAFSNPADETRLPDFGAEDAFPGVPVRWVELEAPPPPDACAFYLPFHYFYPRWWGIYLVFERVLQLATFIKERAEGVLSWEESIRAARIFMYGHEAFHHIVESFATRLEVSHRTPLYKAGFARWYRQVLNTDDCLEEALATSHGIRRAKKRVAPGNKAKASAVVEAFKSYAFTCPPGYNSAHKFLGDSRFTSARNDMAETYLRSSLHVPPKDCELWATFPHAFSGISRVTSRVSYIVRRGSPIASRLGLNARFLRYRDLRQKLMDLAGCKIIRQKGSHEIWESPTGHRFPVPRHTGDLATGTLAKIIKQAGLSMPISEFLAA